MSRSPSAVFLPLCLVLISASPSAAACWGWRQPVYVWYQPVWTWSVPAIPAMPDRTVPETAEPKKMPLSKSDAPEPKPADKKQPPLLKEGDGAVLPLPAPLKTTEAMSAATFEVYAVAREGVAASDLGETIRIGFFNHSERDLTLELGERVLSLGRGEFVNVRLPREFTWKERGGKEQVGRVPAEAVGLEIVFRR